MIKRARKFVWIILAVIVVIIIFQLTHIFPSIGNIFKAKPVTIDNTPILITQINELAQLTTITAFDEVVADSSRYSTNRISNPIIPQVLPLNSYLAHVERLVIISKGKILAGVDLKKLRPEDIHVAGDSVSINLPKAEIQDVIINPSDFQTFIEDGEWSNDAVIAVKLKARKKMIDRAIGENILNLAQERSVTLMQNFLKSANFKKITVSHF